MASAVRGLYSSLVKEATTAAVKSAEATSAAASRTPIQGYIEHVFGTSEEHAEQTVAGNAEKETHLRNLELFLRSKRIHSELVARYNPTQDLTDQERVRLTARRVGLDVPIEHKGDGDSNA